MRRLLDSIDESLDTSTDGFRQTIADIIDLSEVRSGWEPNNVAFQLAQQH